MELMNRHLHTEVVQHAFKKLAENYLDLEQLKEDLIQKYLQFVGQELETVAQIEGIQQNLDRQLQAILASPDFGEDQKKVFDDLAQQIAAIGLMFPNYEELLSQKAASNGIPYAFVQRGEILVRLEDYKILPGEPELADISLFKLALWKSTPHVSFEIQDAFEQGDTFQILHLSELWPKEEAFILRLIQSQEIRLKEEELALQQSVFNTLFQPQSSHTNSETLTLLAFIQQVEKAFEESLALKRPADIFQELLDYMDKALPKEKTEENQPDETWAENDWPYFLRMEDEDFDMAVNWDNLMDLDSEEYTWEEVEEPLYPIGSSVQITSNIAFFEPFLKVKTKGWQGRVVRAVYDDSDQELYFVELDSITQRSLPEALLEFTICDQETLHHSFTIQAASLKAVAERDTPEDAFIAEREIIHTYMWKDQSEEDQKRMYQIMLHQANATDKANWVRHFQSELSYPVMASTENYAPDNAILPNEIVELVGVKDFEPEFGLMAQVRYKDTLHDYPLIDLLPEDEHSAAGKDILLYRLWAEFRLL